MFVSELMTFPVLMITSSTGIKEAARLLRTRDVAAAPVVDRDGRLMGVVSEIDLLRHTVLPDPVAHLRPVLPDGPVPHQVGDVMTTDVQALTLHDDLYEAVRLMAVTGVRSLPVVDSDRVVGVVSRSDLLRALARSDEDILREVQDQLALGLEDDVPCDAEVDAGLVTLTASAPGADLTTARILAARVPGVVGVRLQAAP
ncbi:MAG: domain containing rane protein [Frankiales bacterium]|nr:domain containing rane protein [Frankiales bacterium]